MNYGERISHLREQKQLTQKEMAHQVGITRAALSHYENNRREPDLAMLLRLVDYFGVSFEYLTGASSALNRKASSSLVGYQIIHFKLTVQPGRLL